uniref:Transporter n=1 Tax=Ciona savignyi TaxID=51511 RepID=H2YV19_CIOSA
SRETWGRSIDFLFSAVGYSVGLGNLWRFPYLCFENGGGAFLVPYVLFTLLLGIPMMLLETSFGQYVRGGVMKSWDTIPIFKDFISTYMTLLVWIIKYMVSSCSLNLPWSTCGNHWNTENCVQFSSSVNITHNITSSAHRVSAAEEFWLFGVLGISSGIQNLGSLRSDLVLYMALLWVAVYLVTFKGIKWSSKVIYVTATLPVILIVVVLVRGCTLDGARDGLWFYLYPDLTKLANIQVWMTAATQVGYSTGIGVGYMIFLGSFNNFNQNFHRDVLVIGITNAMTSFLSGFAVFSSLGFMAKKLNVTMENVASSGPGLVFIAYPQSISLLPMPQLWGFLFFLTLLMLGFDSQVVHFECFVTYFIDGSKRLRSIRWHREITNAVMCFMSFCVGLAMVSEGGIYVFEMSIQSGSTGWGLFLICICELVAISWIYGLDNYFKDIKNMIGEFRGQFVLKICWKFVSPMICMAGVIYFLAGFKPLQTGSYIYPPWAQVVAQLISFSSVIFIPGYAVYIKLTSGKSFSQ